MAPRVVFERRSISPLSGEPVGFVLIRDQRANGALEYGYQSQAYAQKLADKLGLELEQSEEEA
jgi:hypothetical protein